MDSQAGRIAVCRHAAGSIGLGIALLSASVGCSGQSQAADPSEAPEAPAATPPAGHAETVDLGETILRQTRSLENSTLNVRFQAHAVATTESAERLHTMLSQRQQRAREQVIVAVRTAETWEFDEPALTRLRQRIRYRLNRWLDAPLVEDVVLTDFRFRVD